MNFWVTEKQKKQTAESVSLSAAFLCSKLLTAAAEVPAHTFMSIFRAAKEQQDYGNNIPAFADLADYIVQTTVAAESKQYYQYVKIIIVAA